MKRMMRCGPEGMDAGRVTDVPKELMAPLTGRFQLTLRLAGLSHVRMAEDRISADIAADIVWPMQ